METNITVRGVDNKTAAKEDNAIKNYIQDKYQKLESLLEKEQQPVKVDIVATVVHPHPNHEVEIHIRAPRFSVAIERKGPEIYDVIDEVLDIAWQDYIKHKDRVIETRRREGAEQKKKDRSI